MRNTKTHATKKPEKFRWKITVQEEKRTLGSVLFQTQCSCGNGSCNGKCGK